MDIAVAGADDLSKMRDWAAEEGWNPGDHDRIAFAAADPHGFLVGRVGGEPATCVSVVRYGAGHAFLGFYIARVPFRGKGLGLATWQEAMRRMDGRNVGLDGVVDQQDNYRVSGFRRAWTTMRYTGTPPRVEPPPGVTLTSARTLPFDTISAYDRRFFPAARDAFLACWLALPGHTALAALREGAIAGLGVIRPSRDGYRVGPLYADSPEVAAALLGELSPAVPAPMAIDVPDVNPAAVRLAEELKLAPEFETARMYTGAVPAFDTAALFGITTLELG